MKKVFIAILVTLCAAFGCSNLLNDARDAVNTRRVYRGVFIEQCRRVYTVLLEKRCSN